MTCATRPTHSDNWKVPFNLKVPGSRPRRPTEALIRGMKLNSFGFNEANDVANAPNGSGESIVASPYKIVRIASATLARERSMR